MLIDFLIVVDPCKEAIAMDVYGFHIECSKIGFRSIYFVGEAVAFILPAFLREHKQRRFHFLED